MTSIALKLETKFFNIVKKILHDLVPPALFLIFFHHRTLHLQFLLLEYSTDSEPQ